MTPESKLDLCEICSNLITKSSEFVCENCLKLFHKSCAGSINGNSDSISLCSSCDQSNSSKDSSGEKSSTNQLNSNNVTVKKLRGRAISIDTACLGTNGMKKGKKHNREI